MKICYEEEDFRRIPLHVDPEIMSGAIVFVGTRVPVNALWGNLASGATLEEILDWFPTVSPEQAEAVLRDAYTQLAAATEQVPKVR